MKINSVINGCILGDMTVQKRSKKGARIQQNCKYKEVVSYLKILLELNGFTCCPICDDTNHIGITHKLTSHTNKFFLTKYNEWFKNGIKIVPENIKLTPELLKWWYICDGCLLFSSTKNSKKSVQLYSMGFTELENQKLVNLLKNIGIKSNISHRKCKSGKIVPQINLTHNGTEVFFEYIGSCPKAIYNSYGYKWRELHEGKTIMEWSAR